MALGLLRNIWLPLGTLFAGLLLGHRLGHGSAKPVPIHIADGAFVDLLIRALAYTLYVDRPEDDFVRGHTWPKHAVSMGGADTMWNVAKLIESVVTSHVKGDFVEAGVWRGANGILARKLFDSLHDAGADHERRAVWCLDSFEWLPPPDPRYRDDQRDIHHTLLRSHGKYLLADLPSVERIYMRFGIDVHDASTHTHLVKGFFNVTAPLVAVRIASISILRLDGDMYQSTWEVLVAMYESVTLGGFVIIDDYGLAGAKKATDDFRQCAQIAAPLQFFLPEGSMYPGGRMGKTFWKKEVEISAAVRARPCYALPAK